MAVQYDKKYSWQGPIPWGRFWVVLLTTLACWLLLAVNGSALVFLPKGVALGGFIFVCIGILAVFRYDARDRTLYWWQNPEGKWRGGIVRPQPDGILISIPWTGWLNYFRISYAGWWYDHNGKMFRNGQETLLPVGFVTRLEQLTGHLLPVEMIRTLLMRNYQAYGQIRAIKRGTAVEITTRYQQVYRFDDPDQLIHFLLNGEREFADLQNRWWRVRGMLSDLADQLKHLFPATDFNKPGTEETLNGLCAHFNGIAKELFRVRAEFPTGKDVNNPFQVLCALLSERTHARAYVEGWMPDLKDQPLEQVIDRLRVQSEQSCRSLEDVSRVLLEFRKEIIADKRAANGATAQYLLAGMLVVAEAHLSIDHPLRQRFGITIDDVEAARRVIAARG